MVAILRGSPTGFVHWLGVQCATWVATSRGSTGRSEANPEGLWDVRCVEEANYLASRWWGPNNRERCLFQKTFEFSHVRFVLLGNEFLCL